MWFIINLNLIEGEVHQEGLGGRRWRGGEQKNLQIDFMRTSLFAITKRWPPSLTSASVVSSTACLSTSSRNCLRGPWGEASQPRRALRWWTSYYTWWLSRLCNVQGVNRGIRGLFEEFCDKWLLEAVAPLNVDNGFAAAILSAQLASHFDNVMDLLSNYIGLNNDGQLKAFVWLTCEKRFWVTFEINTYCICCVFRFWKGWWVTRTTHSTKSLRDSVAFHKSLPFPVVLHLRGQNCHNSLKNCSKQSIWMILTLKQCQCCF